THAARLPRVSKQHPTYAAKRAGRVRKRSKNPSTTMMRSAFTSRVASAYARAPVLVTVNYRKRESGATRGADAPTACGVFSHVFRSVNNHRPCRFAPGRDPEMRVSWQ